MAVLQLCASQYENKTPYLFKITNVKVFSLEEALFLNYYNWKNTADELFAPEFIGWVRNDLRLPDIANKISGYAGLPFNDRLVGFLRVIEYFDDSEINSLIQELDAWAKRVEWERLKDRGDYLTSHGMPDKALAVYKKALSHSRQPRLLNNLALALMQTERYAESAALFKEAAEKEPDNIELKLNYAEACIYLGNAAETKDILEGLPPDESVFRLLGELYNRTGEMGKALENLKRAADSGDSDENIYRLADFYISASDFDNAVFTINRLKTQNARTSIKRAEICKAQADYTSAAKILEKALITWPNDAELWLALSECGRESSNLQRADQAVARALSLQPDNARVKLEAVRVKRAQNNIREYQEALRQLIVNLKNEYREAEDVV